jgi:TM2 domain-containing membrane protein YozV
MVEPMQPPPMSPQEISNKKLAAGLCGILLGGLGVHKFVLGMTTPGVIMLLVTVLTCGVGAAITGVIGMIEGIIYLTKTDAEFYQTYVVGKREWF